MRHKSLVLFILSMSSFGVANAANRYWVGSLFSNWNNILDWSTTSGGLPGASVPAAGDVANFDNGSTVNCTIDVAVNVSGIIVNASYTGKISQGANTIAVTGAATFSGGTFTGGTANFTVAGIYTLSGTAFTSTSGILELQSNAAFTSGSFLHNNGTLRLNATGSPAMTGTSPSLYGLEIVGNNTTYTLSSAGSIPVANTMKISGAGNAIINTGTINLSGNLTLTNTATGANGTATIDFVGGGAQTADGTAITLNESRLPLIVINKPSGTLSLAGNLSFASNITYTAGTVSPGTSTSYIVNNLTISGSFPVYNLTISAAANTTLTIAAGSTVTVTGTLDLENGANLININTGTIAAQGNIIDNNTNTTGGGTGTLLINGTGAQNLTSTGVIYQGILPAVTINKASGTLTLPSLITTRSNWTYVAGTIDAATNNSTVVFGNSLTITGTHTLNNVTFDGGGNYTFTVAAGTTLNTAGTVTISGASNVTINTGTVNLLGGLSLTNTATSGGGSAVLAFTGPGSQSITGALSIYQSSLPAVTINKPSGTLTFPALITILGNWTYTAGTIDATTNNSTVVFANTLTISGTHTLNNVNFEGNFNNTYTVSTGTALTVAGTLTTSGSSNVILNTPVAGANGIQAQGDVIINNTGAGSGGTGGILINGTVNEALTGNAASGQGQLPYVAINKTSGTLTMSGTITVTRDWVYSGGTVNPSTSTVVFGGNNLTVTSAGMSFNHFTVAANTISLGNALTVGGNLTISGAGVLAPGANTINLAGNWTNWGPAGFTKATSTVNFNGAALQTVTDPGGENLYAATVNNSSTGIQLANAVSVAGTLTMTQGNINLNGNTLTLGTAAASPGTLTYTAGTMIGTGSFTRWYAAATVPDLSATGLFPMGTTTNSRPFYITAPSSAPTTGGTLSVAYTDANTNTAVSIPDGASTIQVQDNLNWAVTAGGGLAAGTYDLDAQGTGFGMVGNIADLRLSLVSSVVGTAGANGGNVNDPQVNRTGLTAANLTNTFYVGSVNLISSPLPVTLVFFTAQALNGEVELRWETAMETNNDYFQIERSADGASWADISRVDGHGTSAVEENYTSYDAAPLRGESFYRLVQVDQDGHKTYSEVVSVNIGGVSGLNIYPNPVVDNLVVTGSAVTVASVRVFNSAGNVVEVPVQGGNGQVLLNVAGLPRGIYFLQLGTQTIRFLKK
ncbi:MAG TPA: T9SS type A sorting domain-containing protein [Puia sp.]|jgi:hypothetical protein|nr:T9SS type A sorting domain-containing protein [Puia sp.]